MKKYLFAALALTALVACSKDDDPTAVLTSSEKSVTISIANMASNTRADTPSGTAPATTLSCTEIDDNFYIFFLDEGNVIRDIYNNTIVGKHLTDYFSAGTYTFNMLPEFITKVVVAGNLTFDPNLHAIGKTLDAAAMWDYTETAVNIAAEYETIRTKVVYAAASLERKVDGGGDPVSTTIGTKSYPVYTASLTIAPKMARIEITQISCGTFGVSANTGYDAIGIQSMTLAGGTKTAEMDVTGNYTINFTNFTNDSELNTDPNVIKPDTDGNPETTLNILKPAGTNVWSWNIAPQEKSNLTTSLYVSGDGYTTLIPERTVTINSYSKTDDSAINTFDAGKIYRFAINFNHNNIDATDNYIVAEVTVDIVDWVVVPTNVDFATE